MLRMAADYEAIASRLSAQPEVGGPLHVPKPKVLRQDRIKSTDVVEIDGFGRKSSPLHYFPCPLPIRHGWKVS